MLCVYNYFVLPSKWLSFSKPWLIYLVGVASRKTRLLILRDPFFLPLDLVLLSLWFELDLANLLRNYKKNIFFAFIVTMTILA